MGPLEFASPRALWLLLLAPLLIAGAIIERRRRAPLRFSAAGELGRFAGQGRARFLKVLPALRIVAFVLAVIALARPQIRDAGRQDLSIEGIDILITLDLSTSMEADDFKPKNRLFVAKEVLADFIKKRSNDRLGLVVFSGEAFTQSPLTFDHTALIDLVGRLRTRVLPDGTAIGDALTAALNRLRDSDAKSRVVLLITDGDNNAGKMSPIDAAKAAEALGIKVFTILVGKGGKARVQVGADIFGNPLFKDIDMQVNPQLLQDIAAKTGGEFFLATDKKSLEEGLQKVLDALERSKLVEGGIIANYREEFFPYLGAATLLLLLEFLLSASILRVFP